MKKLKPGDWVETGGILSGGRLTAEKCPECGGRILSNGNYFCAMWTWPLEDDEGNPVKANYVDTCDWALPHPPMRYVDRLLSFRLTGAWETENAAGDRMYEHKRMPGKNGYIPKKYQAYIDSLEPVADDIWWKVRQREQKEKTK